MSTDTSVVLAAGAVLWREVDGRVEVALVHRPRYDDWSLPKGKVERGEHLLATVVREIAEETGFGIRVGRPLGVTAYLTEGRPKRVHYWAGEALDGQFVPDDEVDGLLWLTVEEARERVDRDTDRSVLDEFTRLPHRTVPVLVLRHAKAHARKTWEAPDAERPLSEEGRLHSRRLVPVLSAYAECTVLSSPSVRCVQTVEPYLADSAADLELDAALSEEGFEETPKQAAERLAELVRRSEPTLVCSHRPVLPALLDALRDQADVRIDLDLEKTPLRTAEFVAAHVADGRVVAVERHRP